MLKKLSKQYPTLGALLRKGTVYIENGDYVGKASDGTIVSFGPLWCEKQVEAYLLANPTPDKW